MRFVLLVPVFVILLFLVVADAGALEPGITLDIEGECQFFNVTVTTDMMDEGCYDVKIDVTNPELGRVGKIYDQRAGWISSAYYLSEAFCVTGNQSSSTFQLRADSEASGLNFICRMRDGCSACGTQDTWQSAYYNVTQNCIESSGQEIEVLLLVSALSIFIILAGIAAYVKLS